MSDAKWKVGDKAMFEYQPECFVSIIVESVEHIIDGVQWYGVFCTLTNIAPEYLLSAKYQLDIQTTPARLDAAALDSLEYLLADGATFDYDWHYQCARLLAECRALRTERDELRIINDKLNAKLVGEENTPINECEHCGNPAIGLGPDHKPECKNFVQF